MTWLAEQVDRFATYCDYCGERASVDREGLCRVCRDTIAEGWGEGWAEAARYDAESSDGYGNSYSTRTDRPES